MTELTEQEKQAMAKDIAEAKERINEKAKSESLEALKAKAKEEALKEIEAERKAEAEKQEKETLAKQLEEQKAEMVRKEEEYKKKLDAMIQSQAVVKNEDPFAGNKKPPVRGNPIDALSEDQLDDIEHASRVAFEESLQRGNR